MNVRKSIVLFSKECDLLDFSLQTRFFISHLIGLFKFTVVSICSSAFAVRIWCLVFLFLLFQVTDKLYFG